MKEVWKKIVEFDGDYEVSNLGRVKSVGRFIPRVGPHGDQYFHKERILTPSMDSCRVCARETCKAKQIYIN